MVIRIISRCLRRWRATHNRESDRAVLTAEMQRVFVDTKMFRVIRNSL